MLKVLVVEYKLVSLQYFMDEMTEYEIHDLYNMLKYSDLPYWEMTRWLLYAIVQVNSKRKIKVEDVLKLPWDNDYKEHDKNISNNDIEKLKKKSQEILKNITL